MGQRYIGSIFCSVTSVTMVEKNIEFTKKIIVGFVLGGIK